MIHYTIIIQDYTITYSPGLMLEILKMESWMHMGCTENLSRWKRSDISDCLAQMSEGKFHKFM